MTASLQLAPMESRQESEASPVAPQHHLTHMFQYAKQKHYRLWSPVAQRELALLQAAACSHFMLIIKPQFLYLLLVTTCSLRYKAHALLTA